jgi:hypothetical protein
MNKKILITEENIKKFLTPFYFTEDCNYVNFKQIFLWLKDKKENIIVKSDKDSCYYKLISKDGIFFSAYKVDY